jgi:hypothetical protein
MCIGTFSIGTSGADDTKRWAPCSLFPSNADVKSGLSLTLQYLYRLALTYRQIR